MSDFYVYNSAKERIGIIQNDESVQWLENYQSPGEVKVVVRVTEDNLALLVDGNRIYNTDSDTAARISYVSIAEAESEHSIIARADLTAELLSDRVVMATENVTNVEAAMYAIYAKNRRGLPIEMGTAQGYTERLDMEITWNTVLDALNALAASSGLGYVVGFDPETGIETLKVYKGIDRSVEGSDNYVGYFGTDVGNISNLEITTGTTDLKNVAVVAGEGEGSARTVRIVSLGNVSGENRRELYVDARDIQREAQIAVDTGQVDEKGNPIYEYQTKVYTDAEYNALLDARGYEKLAEHLSSFGVTCDIEQSNLEYGVDYHLGDRMPVKLTDYGITASAVVSSVNRIYESSGTRVVVTLSDFKLTE